MLCAREERRKDWEMEERTTKGQVRSSERARVTFVPSNLASRHPPVWLFPPAAGSCLHYRHPSLRFRVTVSFLKGIPPLFKYRKQIKGMALKDWKMWLEILSLSNIYQAYRQPCVVDARDKTRLFLDFFLEPEGTVKFQSSKVRLKKGYESGLHF